jgi:hypothetical protein
MTRRFAAAAVSAALVALSQSAFADPSGGTADEAKAMLMKAVAAVKADKAKALDMFNKGEGGFLDRDLYVFCIDSVGKEVAIGNPNTRKNLGNNIRAAKDSTGKAFGLEIYAAAQKAEGQVTEVPMCGQGREPTRRPRRKSPSSRERTMIWAAASATTSRRLWRERSLQTRVTRKFDQPNRCAVRSLPVRTLSGLIHGS